MPSVLSLSPLTPKVDPLVPLANPKMPPELKPVDRLSARRVKVKAALVPLRASGTGTDCRKADESRPSSLSALRVATSAELETEKGAPGLVNEGAAEKVFAPEYVCTALSSET